MPTRRSEDQFQHGHGKNFSTTHWTVVMLAAEQESAEASKALERLCKNYWFPLYAYVRRRGYNPEDAQDLTQEFFCRVLEKRYLRLADPERGKFRTFLITSLSNFLANDWQKGQAAKRGSGQTVFSLDAEAPETRFMAEPSEGLSPDKVYDKRWAVALLERVLQRLRKEYLTAGKEGLFDSLKGRALGEYGSDDYTAIGQQLKMSEGALRIAALRLRERYRELLFSEVSHTVASSKEVDEEIRHLIAALRD